MAAKPPECQGCPLFHAKGPVWGCGPPEARVAFVGEAPGPDEIYRQEPFVGRAGTVFNVALKAAGVARGTVYITNVVKCMPPRKGQPNTFRKPTAAEIEFCTSRHLAKELEGRNVVVALGDTAFNHLTRDGVKRGITKWRGTVMDV